MLVFSSQECIAWLAVFMTQSVAIVTLNVITAIVFIKNPSLCKGSLYLVINLAVADVLVGGFSNSVNFVITGTHCNFWKYNVTTFGIWDNIIYSIEQLFPITSMTNIAAISLQRVHATFFPFSHRVIKNWIFVAIMAVVWVLAALFSTALVVLSNLEGQGRSYFYLWCSFNSICLFVICISYAFMVVKICFGAHHQHHGAASRERKLTKTLFIMTLVSLLMYLPFVVHSFLFFTTDIFSSLSKLTSTRLSFVVLVLFYANSLVNPVLYAVRMPEFKKALVSFFRPQQRHDEIPLHDF